MIFTERQITVRKGKATIDEPVILYRGDYEVSIKFTIMESKFRFKSGVNLVDSEKASYGQLAILAPYGGNIFSEMVKCEDGTVTFTLTKEMLDQLGEVGLYSFQIRLFDYYRESRVSIPPVEFGIEVREPVASEDHDNEVINAIVGYSIAKVVDGLKEDVPDTFDDNGNYNKTKWETGDRISQGKLNKIEDALDTINKNEMNDKNALNKQMTSNFNVLQSQIDNMVVESGNTDAEILQARGEHSTLNARLVWMETQSVERFEEVNSQLAHNENKISYFVTPEMYGALKDGVYDDALAINKAIEFGSNNNKKIIMNGNYYIKTPIVLMKNTTLIGTNYNTLIKLQDNSNCEVITVSNLKDSLNNTSVRDITIDGNCDNQTNTNINTLNLNATNNSSNADKHCIFENINIYNSTGVGVYIGSQVREGRFKNIKVKQTKNCEKDGFYIDGTDNYFSSITSVLNRNGIWLNGSNNKIVNSKCFYNKEAGLVISRGLCNQITNFEAQENGTNGLKLIDYSRSNVFSSLVLDTNGRLSENCSEIYFDNWIAYNQIYGTITKRDGLAGNSLYIISHGENQKNKFMGNYINVTTLNISANKSLIPSDSIIPASNTFIVNNKNNINNISDFKCLLSKDGSIEGYNIVNPFNYSYSTKINECSKSYEITLTKTNQSIYDSFRLSKRIDMKENEKISCSTSGAIQSIHFGLLLQLRFYNEDGVALTDEIKSDALMWASDSYRSLLTQINNVQAPANTSYCLCDVSIFALDDFKGEIKASIEDIIIEKYN